MSQERLVLRMLRERGAAGVSNHELVYRHGITRAAAIVHDLRHNHGLEIETRDEGETQDGRQKLCRYVLVGVPEQLKPQAPAEPQYDFGPARPLDFGCGCVRSADGRSWESRCDDHARRADLRPSEVGW